VNDDNSCYSYEKLDRHSNGVTPYENEAATEPYKALEERDVYEEVDDRKITNNSAN
jgi:hypothetical protein